MLTTGSKLKLTNLLILFLALPLKAQTSGEPGIEDNSFLVEEAYNQRYGVVQHIQSFTWDARSQELEYNFTQEWPIDLNPKHQFSYKLQGIRPGEANGFGWGDTLLNYRYQLVDRGRLAITPRVSLIVPSGRPGWGYGGIGVQTNWALSKKVKKKFVMHSNAGWTVAPNAKNALRENAAIHEFRLGQSVIWLAKPRFNVLLESVYESSQEVVAAGRAARNHDVTLNPGIRWAYNLRSGMQIVPGISMPTGIGPSAGTVGLLFYFSVEHPFRKKKS